MREYELMFIVAQTDVKQGYHEQVTEEVRGWVEGIEGRVLRVRPWGLRQLAYDIADNDHGYYVIMQLLLEPKDVVLLEEKMKQHERIIRFLFVQIGEREEGDIEVLTDLVEEDEIQKIATGQRESQEPDQEEDKAEDDPDSSPEDSLEDGEASDTDAGQEEAEDEVADPELEEEDSQE